ncbi:hypothetical protein BsWGS_10590 [Bradybaena similaris]
MNGHILAGTDIAVDYWKIQGKGGRLVHFLTHLHGDHISGLTSSWHRPIYCSEFTSRLLTIRHGLPSSLLKICVLNESMLVSGHGSSSFTVTAYDANHCPGAVMFYFQGDFGNILYTGDFRASPELVDSCRHLAGHIDKLYLDNTFCSPKCVFPSRDECFDTIVSVVERHRSHQVLIGVRKLGKEMLLAQLGLRLNETVGVSPACYHVSQMLFATDIFTITSQDSRPRIRTVPMHTISRRYVDQLNTTQPTIAVIPSAIYTGLDCQPFCRDTNIFVIPYSDHSSYAELLEFVSMLRPARILPIVQQLTGPFGVDISDRADMSCFQGSLLKSRPGRHIYNNSMCDRQLGEGSTESNKERMFLRERLAEGNMAPTHDFSPLSVCKRDKNSHPCKKSGFKSGVRGRKRSATGVVYVSFSADGQMSDYSDMTHPSQQHAHMMGSGTTSHPIQQHSHTACSHITSQQHSHTACSHITSQLLEESVDRQQHKDIPQLHAKSVDRQQHKDFLQLHAKSVDIQQHKDIPQLHAKRKAAQGVDHECGIVDSAASHPHSPCDCPLHGECRKCIEEDACAAVVVRCDGDGARVDERMSSVEMDQHDLVTQQSVMDDSQVDNVSSDHPDFPDSFKSCHASSGQCRYPTDQQWHSLTSTLSDHLPPQGKSILPLTEGSLLLKYSMREECVGGGSPALKPHIGVDNNLVDSNLEFFSSHGDGVLATLNTEVDNRSSGLGILLQKCAPDGSFHVNISRPFADMSESSAASSWDHPGQELDMSGSCPELKLPLDSQDEHGAESTSFTSKSSRTGAESTSFTSTSPLTGAESTSFTSKSSLTGAESTSFTSTSPLIGAERTSFISKSSATGAESTSFTSKSSLTGAESTSFTSKPSPTAAESTSFTSKSSPTASIQCGTRGTGLTRNQLRSSGMLRRKKRIFELKSSEIGSVGHFIASLQEFLRKTC